MLINCAEMALPVFDKKATTAFLSASPEGGRGHLSNKIDHALFEVVYFTLASQVKIQLS